MSQRPLESAGATQVLIFIGAFTVSIVTFQEPETYVKTIIPLMAIFAMIIGATLIAAAQIWNHDAEPVHRKERATIDVATLVIMSVIGVIAWNIAGQSHFDKTHGPTPWMAVAAFLTNTIVATLAHLIAVLSIRSDETRTVGNDEPDQDATLVEETSAAPIIALRCWKVADLGSVAVLRSQYRDDVYWPSGTPMTGEPSATEQRGVHAFRDAAEMKKAYFGPSAARPDVVGKVALWGEVIEFEKGYRAEFAYPVELYARDQKTADMLERFYGCCAGLMSHDLHELHDSCDAGEATRR